MFRDLDARSAVHPAEARSDDYYPVYGDDSTMVADAPTKGKFYVRLERGDSHVMWGNFKTEVTGTEFLRNERALYGAHAAYRSQETTSFGERKTDVTLYAAQPDTLPQRDEFRATGNSVYFLKRQNTVNGSQTLTVEIRDSVTGRVIERRRLVEGEDYRFNYMQGVVILDRPLVSSTGSSAPVRDGALGGDDVYLIVQYEYEPVASDLDGYSVGGRAEQWVDDRVRIGVTAMQETTGGADQKAGGVDVHVRISEKSYIEGEIAASKGEGFGLSRSYDGGLTQSGDLLSPGDYGTALAWRVEGRVDLRDINPDAPEGTIGGYFEQKDAGFSTLDGTTDSNERMWGVNAGLALTDKTDIDLTYDDYEDDDGKVKREGAAVVSHEFDDYWKLSVGMTYTDLMSPLAVDSGKSGYNGSRLDAGVRLAYRQDDDHLYYVFGQGTVSRSGDIHRNDRAGVGAEINLTDAVGVTGEVSYGWYERAGRSGGDHYTSMQRPLLYRNRSGSSQRTQPHGDLVGSTGARLSAASSAGSTIRCRLMREQLRPVRPALTDLGPMASSGLRTSAGRSMASEGGRIRDGCQIDPVTGFERSDFDRYAPSLSVGYTDEEGDVSGRLRGEVRIEDSEDGSRDQNTYLVSGDLAWKTDDHWRAMFNLDAVWSDTRSAVTSYQDTSYIESSIGYAYRPVDNDRLNALFKYSWLYDVPGNGQLVSAATGDDYAPAQRSHILSADVTYDLVPWLSVGGKYGFRIGDVKYRTADPLDPFGDEWQRSSAHLGILRADLHIVRKWDLLVEGRVLGMPEAGTIDYGALAAIYRHAGDNFKFGVGYNFGRFSDDLRDLTLDDQGLYINAVGKF
ncbi:MAG: hypothetical protein R2845_16320 [Thermomicrobiales bacterium]